MTWLLVRFYFFHFLTQLNWILLEFCIFFSYSVSSSSHSISAASSSGCFYFVCFLYCAKASVHKRHLRASNNCEHVQFQMILSKMSFPSINMTQQQYQQQIYNLLHSWSFALIATPPLYHSSKSLKLHIIIYEYCVAIYVHNRTCFDFSPSLAHMCTTLDWIAATLAVWIKII